MAKGAAASFVKGFEKKENQGFGVRLNYDVAQRKDIEILRARGAQVATTNESTRGNVLVDLACGCEGVVVAVVARRGALSPCGGV